jgi:pyrroline-5-carboxylate reductase
VTPGISLQLRATANFIALCLYNGSMGIDQRIAVIGAGNLGSALIAGLLQSNEAVPEQLLATTGTPERAEKLAKAYAIRATAGNNAEVASQGDIVVLAVKPKNIHLVLNEIRGSLRPDQILISLAAAVPIIVLENWLGQPMPVFRALPNLAMRVRESATAIAANSNATPEHRQIVEHIFQAVGTTVFGTNETIEVVTALGGSGPGFLYWIMEALTQGGVDAGMSFEAASAMTRQTILGAALLVRETGLDPAVLRAQVTTPNGTTAAGIAEMEKRGAREALIAAVAVATERGREIGRQLAAQPAL